MLFYFIASLYLLFTFIFISHHSIVVSFILLLFNLISFHFIWFPIHDIILFYSYIMCICMLFPFIVSIVLYFTWVYFNCTPSDCMSFYFYFTVFCFVLFICHSFISSISFHSVSVSGTLFDLICYCIWISFRKFNIDS